MDQLQNSHGRLPNAKVAQSQNFNTGALMPGVMMNGQHHDAERNKQIKQIHKMNQSLMNQNNNHGSSYMLQQGFASPTNYQAPHHGHNNSHHLPKNNHGLQPNFKAPQSGKYPIKNQGLEAGATRYSPKSLDKYGMEQRNLNGNESSSSRIQQFNGGLRGQQSGQEQRTSKGNIVALTGGPLTKPRYINDKIETELIDFKKEIEDKFKKSELRVFKFPLKKQSRLPEAMRSTRYGSTNNSVDRSHEAAPGIGMVNSSRKQINQSSFVSYQNEQLQARPQYQNSDSPKRHGAQGQMITKHNAEQSRYNDIMRQINNTEQFIKAKQAIAQQERGKGQRNVKKNLNMTEIQAIANSTGSSLMQTQYNKGMIDPSQILQAPMGKNSNGKIKMKLGSPERTRNDLGTLPYNTGTHDKQSSPIRKGTKYPKTHVNTGMDSYGPPTSLRDTIAKFNKNTRVDQSLQLNYAQGSGDQSYGKLNIPKINSPHGGAVSQSISNFESLKNSNTNRGKNGSGPQKPHQLQEINTNLRDRSLNLKMNYGGYKGLAPSQISNGNYSSTNQGRPPPIIQNQNFNYQSRNENGSKNKQNNKDMSPLAAFEREQAQQRIFQTYIQNINQNTAANSNFQGVKQSHLGAKQVKQNSSRYAPPLAQSMQQQQQFSTSNLNTNESPRSNQQKQFNEQTQKILPLFPNQTNI